MLPDADVTGKETIQFPGIQRGINFAQLQSETVNISVFKKGIVHMFEISSILYEQWGGVHR